LTPVNARTAPGAHRGGWGCIGPPAPPERLETMGCTNLAAAMLDGSDVERRAILSVYVNKKCL